MSSKGAKGMAWAVMEPQGHNLKLTLDILGVDDEEQKKVSDSFNGGFLRDIVEWRGYSFFYFFKGSLLLKVLGNPGIKKVLNNFLKKKTH